MDTKLGRRLSTRDVLIGSSPRSAKRAGVRMKPRAVGATGRTVVFEDGATLDVAAVIWATGYTLDHSWIDLPITGPDGQLVHRRGVTDVPGLYFLGLPWQYTRGSALVGWVKDDAEFIAERIAERAQTSAESISRRSSTWRMTTSPPAPPAWSKASRRPSSSSPTATSSISPSRPVTKEIAGDTVRMLAYNGSIPGPTLKVQQGSEIVVNARNEGDLEATVHWHGLRLDNRYDGTHETQAPMPVGGSFTYRIEFPDPGVYWYHPHIREDYGQEMGLYGNIVVEPADPDYWPPAHREVVLTLDDILIEDGRVAAFSRTEPSYVAMGRFGTTMLVGGETELSLDAKQGEIVRFFLTNTANTRVFRVGFAGASMKLVGGDSGRVEHEELAEDVILAPSERVVVDVLFDTAGEAALEHRTPEHTYRLATVAVSEDQAESLGDFHALRENADLVAERERIAPYLEAEPDKTLSLVAEMDMGDSAEGATGVFACPMHADIVATWEGKCPKCGMKLLPAGADVAAPTDYACPMHPEITATWAGECPKCGMTLRANRCRGPRGACAWP